MNITFNSFYNIDEVVFYLCNPNKDEIGVIEAKNRVITLRFNDLSEMSFEIGDDCQYYDLIEAKRLINIDKIGWFQITQVIESDDGTNKYKTVSTESHQTIFKNFGFYSEERVYCFYNRDDPTDSKYNANDAAAIPSVVGQLYQQTGIRTNLAPSGTEFEPTHDYDEWTIVYISPSLVGSVLAESGTYRSFEDDNKYAYEFMCNDVADAFQVVFDFDIVHHAIKIKTLEEIVEKTNIYLSFDNLMNSIEVTENSDDIVTVLNCMGGDLDITMVNPMGTNYIVDFTYFMDKVDYRWMTPDLISALENWKTLYESRQNDYINYVQTYRNLCERILPYEDEIEYNNLKITEIKAVQEEYTKWYNGTNGGKTEDTENIYAHSNATPFVFSTFDVDKNIEVYPNGAFYFRNSYNVSSKKFNFYTSAPSVAKMDGEEIKTKYVFSGTALEMTLDEAFETINQISVDKDGNITNGTGYLYFSDDSTGKTYCKLRGKATVNADTQQATYSCAGYFRYCLATYSGECMDAFTSRNNYILSIIGDENSSDTNTLFGQLNAANNAMQTISSEVSLVNYFSNTDNFPNGNNEDLYRELKCYWIEGEYNDDHLSVDEDTTIPQMITLAKELMSNGHKELEKVCQPRFSFSISAINFLKIFEFRKFAHEIALGKVITIQKNDEVHYYPALTEMSMNLDIDTEFTLTFSNAYKMNDWGFTFTDLISKASNVSRKVTSNWTNLTSYMKDKQDLMRLVNDSLDLTLRAANSNLFNQEFIIDQSGILGRQFADDSHSSFANEQIRIINNLIMFTDDKWQTIKTALGKVTLADGTTTYGLIADTIVGNLLLGNALNIMNTNSTVTIDDDGITIKNNDGDIVFRASPTDGVAITTYATKDELEDGISDLETKYSSLEQTVDGFDFTVVYATKDEVEEGISSLEANLAFGIKTENGDTFSYLTASAQYIKLTGNQLVIDSDNLTLDKYGNLSMTGYINATSGQIADFSITGDGLESEYIKLNSKEIRFPMQSTFNLNDEVSIYTTENGAYITTVNSSDFTIQNLSGAGIKFSKDKTSVSQTITMTFNGPNLSSAGDKGNALVINYSQSSPDSGWGASYDFNYTATLSAALPYPCTKTVYIRYLYRLATTEYRTHSLTLSFPAFTTSISGTVNLASYGETVTRYNPNDSRFETGVYFSSYSRANTTTATITSYSSTNNTLYSLGNFSPYENQKYSLGSNSNAWGNLYLYSGTQVGSDIRLKNSVEKLSENLDVFFDGLVPVSYKLNNGSSQRRHIGFIAQDVEASLINAKIDSKNFAGLCVPSEDELYYMLRYDEFIALNTSQIQKLKTRVGELEKELKEIKGENK